MRLGIIAFSLFVMMLSTCNTDREQVKLRKLRIEKSKLEIELLNAELDNVRGYESFSGVAKN